jgi:predicted histone-like DNA-binding protein
MEVQVHRYQRRKVAADPNSPLVYHLKQVPGTSETYTLESLARSIEKSSSLTAEDVVHAVRALTREMKEVFLGGNRVKIDGLGIFSLTFNATGVETEKECNVKTINKVNIRFRADKALRLENESTARVRAGYGVKFAVADTRTQKKAALRSQPQAVPQPQKREAPLQPQPREVAEALPKAAPARREEPKAVDTTLAAPIRREAAPKPPKTAPVCYNSRDRNRYALPAKRDREIHQSHTTHTTAARLTATKAKATAG